MFQLRRALVRWSLPGDFMRQLKVKNVKLKMKNGRRRRRMINNKDAKAPSFFVS